MELKPDDFSADSLRSKETLAVLFVASWCSFCRQFYPAFQAAAERTGIAWGPMDISDDDNPLWDVFGIAVVPTIILFKGGKAVFRRDGVLGRGLSEKSIEETVEKMKLLSTTP
jgi:thioredoxin-like negative regulator of GroEL